MTIDQISNILRSELYNNGYEYGFSADGKRYLPDTSRGFDSEYYKLSCTIYTVQEPKATMEERLGTCIDAVVLMKHMLDELNVKSRIWLLHNKDKNKAHTILTFEAEDKIVYLELTPQFSKPWYGKPITFASEQEFIETYKNEWGDIYVVTDSVVIGEQPHFLLDKLN